MVKLYISKLSQNENPHGGALHLLDIALQENYTSRLSDYNIEKTPSGKPFFADNPTVKFNLSHSGEYTAAAISDCEVGVDIERIKPVNPGVVKRYLSSLIRGDTDEDIIESWCRRESYGKYTGDGFLRADFSNPHYIEILKIIPGYIIAVCTLEKVNINLTII